MSRDSVCPIDFVLSPTELNDELLACISCVSMVEVHDGGSWRSHGPLVKYPGVSANRTTGGCYRTRPRR
jgi:hypothetical protein